ncbi:MAG: hypothetical protein R3F59_34175 [Myxococcota bacterium]
MVASFHAHGSVLSTELAVADGAVLWYGAEGTFPGGRDRGRPGTCRRRLAVPRRLGPRHRPGRPFGGVGGGTTGLPLGELSPRRSTPPPCAPRRRRGARRGAGASLSRD